MELPERLEVLFSRLAYLPRCSSAVEALRQLCRESERVEDEHCDVPKQTPPPPPSVFTGRMYPPQEDETVRLDDGSIVAKTRKHLLTFGTGGSITVALRRSPATIEFFKAGANE